MEESYCNQHNYLMITWKLIIVEQFGFVQQRLLKLKQLQFTSNSETIDNVKSVQQSTCIGQSTSILHIYKFKEDLKAIL